MLKHSEVAAGDQLPAQSFPVRRADLVRYAGASGDFNPIHWNERFAKSVGLPDVIGHGMFTMAEAIRVVTDWCGDPGLVQEYMVRFSKPVVVPDGLGEDDGARLTVTGKVGAILENEDGGFTARVDLTAKSGDEKVLGLARALVRLA
jgi:acyl dehydratase